MLMHTFFPPKLFKLADRMRSMRTNGASKNRDYSDANGSIFLSLVSVLFLVPMVCFDMYATYGMYTYGMYTYGMYT